MSTKYFVFFTPRSRLFCFYLVVSMALCLNLPACDNSEKSTDDVTEILLRFDELTDDDTTFWQKADGWANGTPFLNGWCQQNITFDTESMQIQLQQQDCSGKSFGSGEYRSVEFYQYVGVEARLMAADANGVITSLFSYTGPADGNPHDEIDVEIFGKSPTVMQVNYWTNGVEHPTEIQLGFDASADYHTYAFEWRANSIKWYVDSVLVHEENGGRGTLPSNAGKIMMNLWACENIDSWCGVFDQNQAGQIVASYDWIRITLLE